MRATIVEKALGIAADICIYTNRNLTIETLGDGAPLPGERPAPVSGPGQSRGSPSRSPIIMRTALICGPAFTAYQRLS